MKRAGAVALSALLAMTAPVAAHAEQAQDPLDRFERTDGGRISSSFVPASADGAAKVTVMVEMQTEPVAVVDATNRGQLTRTQKDSLKAARKAEQDSLKPAIERLGGQVTSQVQSAYNGIKVRLARKDVATLEGLPGVKAVHSVQVYEPTNATSVPYLGVDQVWEDNGFTGEGVKVAIIDTGIDYTHATFGGPGTKEAFAAADAASHLEADPLLFGPEAPRVKGGWDFVGDNYDANDDSPVLKPDTNPLDCQGHGTHVAGTTGGGGVTAEGEAYAGPYDSTTSGTDFLVGPGVAPQVDLYALRVFGCEGSTDVTVEAIDWAVDNDMDVINMSLGASYGSNDDPTAVASSNAAAAGIVVVASAGNSGHNPYLTGSPGAADGVISVAASDSTESFPGATLTIGGDTEVEAINANDAPLPGDDFEIVVLKDDAATKDYNESLGCRPEDFVAALAGSTGTGPQVAVSFRGTCARVARAIHGQAAGFEAVVMVNSDDSLPPFEGPITENPDDGTPANVTIPFLGVRKADGAKLVDGETLTMAPKTLANPGYERYASFTSGGPRSNDSALKPTVTAPGVSIASAAVGSGTGFAIMSGTSMAAPHVAGVAALGVQAHPDWTGQDVSAALVTTARPAEILNYRVTTGGGLVDAKALVEADVFAYGDAVVDGDAPYRESTLSFGFAELATDFTATRTVTVVNTGTAERTYSVAYQPSAQSLSATVTFDHSSITVPAGGRATVDVTLDVEAAAIPSSLTGSGQHRFREVSGNVVLTSDDNTLTVGALLVPRPSTNVTAELKPSLKAPNTQAELLLSNPDAVIAGSADVYTWGLEDAEDQTVQGGFDLQAAGVQSFPFQGNDTLLVFALSTHDRFSNAASIEFDVLLDTNRDGKDDIAVFSYDSGAIRAGAHNGVNEVFVYNFKTRALSAAGFYAGSPTDSSTVLLPVRASALGLKGAFRFSAASFYGDADWDQFAGRATYDPASKALTDGSYVEVAPDATVSVPVTLDRGVFSSHKPKGFMVVSYDNPAGSEALLVPVK